jgi:Rad3-related DNA helicase
VILSPSEIGMPSTFPAWRTGQGEAIDRVVDAFQDKRFVVLCAPTGAGKTGIYIAVALLMGWRVLCVTSSKGLQDQLMRDFEDIGMVDIRGRANYQCDMGASITCEEGSHMKCPSAKSTACKYRAAQSRATTAQFVTTNYTYEMMVYMYGEGLGKFDLLVLDEGHDADQEVCGVMGQTFTSRHVSWLLNKNFPERAWDCPIERWRAWAGSMLPLALSRMEMLKDQANREVTVSDSLAKAVREWGELVKSLETVVMANGPWESQEVKGLTNGRAYRLEPLWAKQYASQVLFRDFPRVLVVSATARPKTMDLLGVPTAEYEFHEHPYLFPIRRSPVYFIPTACVQYDSTPEEMALIQQRIDEIMDARQDRNGLIHAVSYRLRDWVMEHTLYNHVMLTHERNSDSTRDTIRQFENLQFSPPAVLVSPSIATGNDFAFRKAEYQIIPKLPSVIVKDNRIMEARCLKKKGGDPMYRNYLMAQTLAQMFGRIMRAPTDRGETFILDNNFEWARKVLAPFSRAGWHRSYSVPTTSPHLLRLSLPNSI